MDLPPILKKAEGLIGNCLIRGIYDQENFPMAWYMDFRFKIQWATKMSPEGSLLSSEPDTDIQWLLQRPVCYSLEKRAGRTGITDQKLRSLCGKIWGISAVSGFFSV